VHKYGGSSLATPAALQTVARRCVAHAAAGHALVVVVSAMGRTTEDLLAQAMALSAQPPRRELDMLATAGERICMALLCVAISACGGHAISLTGSQSGIITDTQHQNARILAVRPQRIHAALDRGQIAVVAGYQGVSADREVTTLGRGGSDTTAVALAAALGASACEIYSDVDGVFTADPRVCPQARLLAEVDYTCMQGLADAGARVLNADAVAFAQRAGIAIDARRTAGDPAKKTRIAATPVYTAASGPQAVAHLAHVSCVHGAWLPAHVALWPALAEAGARVLACEHAALWIDRGGMLDTAPERLAACLAPFELQAWHCSWATLVGRGPLAGWVPAAAAVLGEAAIPVQGMAVRGHTLSAAVPPEVLHRAVAALHTLVV
jgi:aspartate kinase